MCVYNKLLVEGGNVSHLPTVSDFSLTQCPEMSILIKMSCYGRLNVIITYKCYLYVH